MGGLGTNQAPRSNLLGDQTSPSRGGITLDAPDYVCQAMGCVDGKITLPFYIIPIDALASAARWLTELLGGGAAEAAAPRTVAEALSRGLLRPDGKLNPLLNAIEKAYRTAGPKNAAEALNVVRQATTAVGLDIGVGAMGAGGSIVLTNVGGITTTITSAGEIVIQRGADLILRLSP